LGELDKADEYCRKALANDPINADAWLLSGQIAQQRSNMNQALKAYTRVTEIAPTNPHGWTLGAWCMNFLGWSTDIVIDWCERAQVLEGANHRLLAVTRAHALYRRGHYREALEIYDSLLVSEPDDESLQNLRELCLRELDKQT
jgi:tetratricopeptide (TPR) repeat protein